MSFTLIFEEISSNELSNSFFASINTSGLVLATELFAFNIASFNNLVNSVYASPFFLLFKVVAFLIDSCKASFEVCNKCNLSLSFNSTSNNFLAVSTSSLINWT
ncbi:hypothetical protein [Mycoplasmopsis alligatoris]|uniref:hypothetical protein n=1 Tax=Mycoplasmopsis alligatoris TaxID=47687 RepID=UPI00058CBD27|nr:hypothetical protein [Mycoplasmopsis alligatoris]